MCEHAHAQAGGVAAAKELADRAWTMRHAACLRRDRRERRNYSRKQALSGGTRAQSRHVSRSGGAPPVRREDLARTPCRRAAAPRVLCSIVTCREEAPRVAGRGSFHHAIYTRRYCAFPAKRQHTAVTARAGRLELHATLRLPQVSLVCGPVCERAFVIP